ncbi:MAG TPA: GLPGLI family protein [Segetibacter sp.]|jgi:GLPGLI family protein
MKKIIITALSSVTFFIAQAQTQFIVKGKIEFEKITNLHKQLQNDSWGEMMKKTSPQFKTEYFDLYFDNNKTLFKPGRAVVTTQKVPEWLNGPAAENVVFNDLSSGTSVSQKAVFESSFLIQDSLRKANWKITTDTRTIAGFECRKATTIIMDSVYVVAFYTDQIVPAGGPESFNGLPGMILGLAVPRLNTTWFATKLELVDVKESDLAAPKKGKKTNNADLNLQLKTLMKNWGPTADRNIWKILI